MPGRNSSAALDCANRLARVLRSWRHRPFEVDFETASSTSMKSPRSSASEPALTCARRALTLRLYRTGTVSAGGEGFSQVVRRQEGLDCLCLPA